MLTFQGRRETVQCGDEAGGRRFRESCHCVLKDSSADRCLWEFRAEECTIQEHRADEEPWVDQEAVMELLKKAGCSSLPAADAVGFLVCLAGEKVAEYFQWQMRDRLEAVVTTREACHEWQALMPRPLADAGALKRKLPDSGTELVRVQRQRMCLGNSILGKRTREIEMASFCSPPPAPIWPSSLA